MVGGGEVCSRFMVVVWGSPGYHEVLLPISSHFAPHSHGSGRFLDCRPCRSHLLGSCIACWLWGVGQCREGPVLLPVSPLASMTRPDPLGSVKSTRGLTLPLSPTSFPTPVHGGRTSHAGNPDLLAAQCTRHRQTDRNTQTHRPAPPPAASCTQDGFSLVTRGCHSAFCCLCCRPSSELRYRPRPRRLPGCWCWCD